MFRTFRERGDTGNGVVWWARWLSGTQWLEGFGCGWDEGSVVERMPILRAKTAKGFSEAGQEPARALRWWCGVGLAPIGFSKKSLGMWRWQSNSRGLRRWTCEFKQSRIIRKELSENKYCNSDADMQKIWIWRKTSVKISRCTMRWPFVRGNASEQPENENIPALFFFTVSSTMFPFFVNEDTVPRTQKCIAWARSPPRSPKPTAAVQFHATRCNDVPDLRDFQQLHLSYNMLTS